MGKIYSTKYFCNTSIARLGKILTSENFQLYGTKCIKLNYMQTLHYIRKFLSVKYFHNYTNVAGEWNFDQQKFQLQDTYNSITELYADPVLHEMLAWL